MGFDAKAMIDKVVDKAKNDPKFMENLQKDPEKTIEGVIGMDIPDGAVDAVLAGVKSKIAFDKLGGLGKLLGK